MHTPGISNALSAISWLAGIQLSERRLAFDIEPQPLDQALSAVAEQAGIQVLIYMDEASSARQAEGVDGMLGPKAALQQLLADSSGLRYEFIDRRTVAIDQVSERFASTRTGLSDRGALHDGSVPIMLLQCDSWILPADECTFSGSLVSQLTTYQIPGGHVSANVIGTAISAGFSRVQRLVI